MFRNWSVVLLLLLCLLLLTGCSNNGTTPAGVAPAVSAVVIAVWKLRSMGNDPLLADKVNDVLKDALFIKSMGKHVLFFLRFRAEAHNATSANQDQVTQAVAAEYDSVRNFIDQTIGLNADSPRALITSTDNTPTHPAHLDFGDVLRVRVTDVVVDPSAKKLAQVKRWERAVEIIWRAAALEPEIWTPNFSADAMKELLDRRMRITERMVYQVSPEDAGVLQPNAAQPTGPWPDGQRVRMFEYPILSKSLANKIGAANIGPGKTWVFDFTGDNLYYNVGNGRRIRNAAAAGLVPAQGVTFTETYPYDLLPGANPAQVIDALFQPSEDFWDRSWIYCDHVLAALHIESLRFGKLRREGKDDTFNSAVNNHPRGWAELRPLLPGSPGDPALMADDASKPPSEPRFFSRGPMRQVQPGDHVVFWNSIMYGLLSDGAWSLENAIITEVESEWTSNDIGESVLLMGHGTSPTTIGQFRKQLTADLNYMIGKARQKAQNAAGNSTPWLRSSSPLVRWAPFGESWTDGAGQPQDPWWLRIPYADSGDWQGRAIGRDATLRTLPDAVEYDPAAGFTSPQPADGGGPNGAAYFPLWVPAQNGKWQGYIERHKKGETATEFRLEPLKFDKKNIPGLIVPFEFDPDPTHPRPFVYTVRPIVVR